MDAAGTGDGGSAGEHGFAGRGEIQLLLTDIVMPDGMTGKELAAKLLEDKPDLKVIYTSGYTTLIFRLSFVFLNLAAKFDGLKLLNTPSRTFP
jgi:CheY-like chemotaxis protein